MPQRHPGAVPQWHPAIWVAGAGLLALPLWLIYTFHAQYPQLFPPCLVLRWTGLFCPGCGMTRAVHALLHLEFGRAFQLNAYFFLGTLPLLGFVAAERWRGVLLLSRAAHHRLFWGYLGGALLFTVLRNLPYSPFNWLAPI